MAKSYAGITLAIWNRIRHFDFDKYWRFREYVATHNSGPKAYYCLYRVKKMDAFCNASLGTHLGNCAHFGGKPFLPHGLNGIIISNDASIGENCTIYHQVTVGGGSGGSPTIGNNVLIGAGAKVIGPITVGNNVKIGAGCVVAIDIPDGATVVMEKPRIILKHQTLADND